MKRSAAGTLSSVTISVPGNEMKRLSEKKKTSSKIKSQSGDKRLHAARGKISTTLTVSRPRPRCSQPAMSVRGKSWRCRVANVTDEQQAQLVARAEDDAFTQRCALRNDGTTLDAFFVFSVPRREGELRRNVLDCLWQAASFGCSVPTFGQRSTASKSCCGGPRNARPPTASHRRTDRKGLYQTRLLLSPLRTAQGRRTARQAAHRSSQGARPWT
jgi:hypothetical protein